MNIHVIGVGAIGSLIATHLRRTLSPSANITLMLKQPSYSVTKNAFGPHTPITVRRSEATQVTTGFKWEIVSEGYRGYQQTEERASPVESNMLRDLVFNSDGSVRKNLGYGSHPHPHPQQQQQQQQQQGMEEYGVPKTEPFVFKRVAAEYSDELASASTPIQNLLVTTKANSILSAISSIRHRLSPSSTIVLMHNGMGVFEQIVSELYQNPEDRPHFILGSISHGAWKKSQTEIVHTTSPNVGAVRFGIVPDWRGRDYERSYWDAEDMRFAKLETSDIVTPSEEEDRDGSSAMQDYTSLHQMVEALRGLKELNSKWDPISEVQTMLRQKLAVNCVINPLTALLNVRNGDLFALPGSKALCQRLCKEASDIFCKEAQMQSGEERIKFKADPMLLGKELELFTQQIARFTGANFSSMLVDVRRGASTEIEYLNEYLIRRGEEMEIPTPNHEMLASLVRMKWHTGLSTNQHKRRQ